ncbi:MAG TPA: replication-associated recombination protein A [Solirubrobacteraceae bacterium]|nr:replication-associated recombination protein A [Solirubrobacteraceae bacterium]
MLRERLHGAAPQDEGEILHLSMERLFEQPAGGAGGGEPSGRRTPDAPLAVRMRPASLDDFVGQEHLLGEGSALRTAIEAGRPHSMVLYGPPGSGKTTLARIVAAAAGAALEALSAVQVGRPEVRAVIERAQHRRDTTGEQTIFFPDEIHRFNKAQQDALLPAVETGLVTLIGATTENPYFEVNSALLSRLQVYELHSLAAPQIELLLRRALADGHCGDAQVPDEVVQFLAARAGGDARTALAGLELACATAAQAGDGSDRSVTLEHAQDAIQRRALLYDKRADQHYDTISAWIKATRGSDPDASLYYLAVMLEGGEDPRFIVRRMVVLASEDIGNADPRALEVAVAAAHAVEHVGLPECQFALAQAAIYLSLAPKSDAVKRAIGAARGHVRDHGAQTPPDHLRSSGHPGAAALGRGEGYDNPHRRPGHLSEQELAPEGARDARFYEPDEAEAELARRLEQIRRARGR